MQLSQLAVTCAVFASMCMALAQQPVRAPSSAPSKLRAQRSGKGGASLDDIAEAPASPLSTKQIVSRVSNVLVTIVTRSTRGREIASGSGFVIGSNTIATNLHVFKWADNATVKLLSDGVQYSIRSIVALDVAKDVCVLDVDIPAAIPLPLGDSSLLQVGDDIIVGGSPRGLEGSFSKGIISALRKGGDSIQIDAPISPGSSGGPVVNMKGQVIGIATATLTESQNLNFAAPADMLLNLEYSWEIARAHGRCP